MATAASCCPSEWQPFAAPLLSRAARRRNRYRRTAILRSQADSAAFRSYLANTLVLPQQLVSTPILQVSPQLASDKRTTQDGDDDEAKFMHPFADRNIIVSHFMMCSALMPNIGNFQHMQNEASDSGHEDTVPTTPATNHAHSSHPCDVLEYCHHDPALQDKDLIKKGQHDLVANIMEPQTGDDHTDTAKEDCHRHNYSHDHNNSHGHDHSQLQHNHAHDHNHNHDHNNHHNQPQQDHNRDHNHDHDYDHRHNNQNPSHHCHSHNHNDHRPSYDHNHRDHNHDHDHNYHDHDHRTHDEHPRPHPLTATTTTTTTSHKRDDRDQNHNHNDHNHDHKHNTATATLTTTTATTATTTTTATTATTTTTTAATTTTTTTTTPATATTTTTASHNHAHDDNSHNHARDLPPGSSRSTSSWPSTATRSTT